MDPSGIRVEIEQVEEAEVDEMWSFVGKKSQQRWLWHAIDHQPGVVLAYVLGTHQDDVFIQFLRDAYRELASDVVDRSPGWHVFELSTGKIPFRDELVCRKACAVGVVLRQLSEISLSHLASPNIGIADKENFHRLA